MTSGSFGMMTAIVVTGIVEGRPDGECKRLNHLRHDAAAGFVGGEPRVCRPIQMVRGSWFQPLATPSNQEMICASVAGYCPANG
jgi:hypothetical protein